LALIAFSTEPNSKEAVSAFVAVPSKLPITLVTLKYLLMEHMLNHYLFLLQLLLYLIEQIISNDLLHLSFQE
jgi:hypothetical protein